MKLGNKAIGWMALTIGFAAVPAAFAGVGTTISVDWALDEVPDNSNHTCTFMDGAFFFPAADGYCTLRRAIREAGARPLGDRPINIVFAGLDGTNADADDVQYDAVNMQWTLPIGPSSAADHWRLKPRSITDKTGQVTIQGPALVNGLPRIFIETESTLEIEMTDNVIRRIGMFGGGGFHFKEAGNSFRNGTWGLARDGMSIVFKDETNSPQSLAGPHGVLVRANGDNAVIRDSYFAGAATKAIEAQSGSTGVQILDNRVGLRIDGTIPAVPANVECETQPIPPVSQQPPSFTSNPNDWYGGWGIQVSGSGATISGNRLAAMQNIRSTNDTPPMALEIFGAMHNVTQNTIGRDGSGTAVGVCGQGIKFSGEKHSITQNIVDQARRGFENTKGAILWSDTTIPGNITGGTTLQDNVVIDGAELNTFTRYFEMGPMIHDQTRLFEPGQVAGINGTAVTGGAAVGWPCPNCVIDFYRDDLDANEEGLEYLGAATADASGNFNFTLPQALAPGQGLRTTTTSALDNDIPNSFAGTTSEMSSMAFVGCPTVLSLSGQVLSGTQTFEATQKITTSNVQTAPNSNITFIVGQSAELGDMTSTGSNATFTVIVDPSADCVP